MSGNESSQSKRSQEDDTFDDAQNKRIKTESGLGNDAQFDDIFNDPIPGFGSSFTGSDGNNAANNSGSTMDIDFDNLPANFLDPDPVGNSQDLGTKSAAATVHKQADIKKEPASLSNIRTNDSRPGISSTNSVPSASTSTGPNATSSFTSSNLNPSNPGSIPSSISNPLSKMPVSRPLPSVISSSQPYQHTTLPYTDPRLTASQDKDNSKYDSSKLNDAIAAAGVNLQQEEEILAQQQLNRRSELSGDVKSMLRGAKPPAFLNAFHVASFMSKVAKENGVQQNFLQDGELLELVSASCEHWMSNILSKTIILSRHRRRGIPALNNSAASNANNRNKRAASSNSASRSELSKGLRDLATKQKELEEKRVAKRVLLGLEKNASDAAEAASENSKAGAEETLHRAANATAAMMTMNPGRKKYSWMTPNAGGNDQAKGSADKDGKNKQSSIISVRGDNGLRFREIRSGNSVTMKDLLGAIEDERMGTEKAIIKGFAKLKD